MFIAKIIVREIIISIINGEAKKKREGIVWRFGGSLAK